MHNEIEYVFNLLENHRLKEALVQIHGQPMFQLAAAY